jgi:hypothetical protein
MTDPIREALRRQPKCPSPESLIDVIEHRAPGDRASLEDHLRSCPYCQAELALYRGFQTAEVSADEREAVEAIVKSLGPRAREETPRRSFWGRLFAPGPRPVWLAGAAFAMAAVLIAVGLTSQSRFRHSSPSVADSDQTLRSSAITVTSPVGDVIEAPRAIEWRAVPGGQRYSVELDEVDGNPIFHKNVTTPEVRLPEEVRTLIKPSKKILLTIEAMDSSGAVLARSGTIAIRVANPR